MNVRRFYLSGPAIFLAIVIVQTMSRSGFSYACSFHDRIPILQGYESGTIFYALWNGFISTMLTGVFWETYRRSRSKGESERVPGDRDVFMFRRDFFTDMKAIFMVLSGSVAATSIAGRLNALYFPEGSLYADVFVKAVAERPLLSSVLGIPFLLLGFGLYDRLKGRLRSDVR